MCRASSSSRTLDAPTKPTLNVGRNALEMGEPARYEPKKHTKGYKQPPTDRGRGWGQSKRAKTKHPRPNTFCCTRFEILRKPSNLSSHLNLLGEAMRQAVKGWNVTCHNGPHDGFLYVGFSKLRGPYLS